MAIDWQNGFEAILDDRVTATDTFIPMTPVPTPSEGRLILEDNSSSNYEIIHYTSKDLNGVYTTNGGTRNEDGNSTGIHPSGSRIRMNITAQDLRGMNEKIDDWIAATNITTDQITDLAITTPKLADDSVTSEKLSPSKSIDANGWQVWDYGTWKEYQKNIVFSDTATASQEVRTQTITDKPAGITGLTTANIAGAYCYSSAGNSTYAGNIASYVSTDNITISFVNLSSSTRTFALRMSFVLRVNS